MNKTVEELWKAIVILPNRDKSDLYKKIQEDVNSNLYKLSQEIKEQNKDLPEISLAEITKEVEEVRKQRYEQK